jgi:hypothetical protein
MFVRFQYLDQVDAWKQSYLKTAKNSSVMTALFQNLSADTGLDITWESSVEASLFDVSVTLPPTMAATIDCPAADSASFFESNVVVSFAGNPDDATSDQLLALEQAFLESYNSANSLSSGICDTLFRVLTNVTINVDGSYSSSRRLKQELTKKKFTFQFRVIGSCRYCAKSTNLFYNDALRRTLLVAEDESLPRALQVNSSSSSSPSDDCLCPVNTTERSPTVDEFFTSFNSTVSELREAGTLTFIESIVGAPVEIDPVECSAEVNSFETAIALEVSGNPDAITENEKRSLEAAFETTYNTLIQGYCDPLFRNVAEVTISPAGASGSNSTTEKDGARFRRKIQKSTTMAKKFTFLFRIKGICRGCPKETKLFNDALRRQLGRSLALTNDTAFLEDSGQCFCPIDSIGSRAPSPEEFTPIFNETIFLLDLPNVVAIFDTVVELAPPVTASPTTSIMPSLQPSPGPSKSNSPSKGPSGVPSNSVFPSNSPSRIQINTFMPFPKPSPGPSNSPRAPTKLPTNFVIPSLAPSLTQNPSRRPSSMPSPSPSKAPTPGN